MIFVLFLQSTPDVVYRFQRCLTIFTLFLGLKINLDKRTIIGIGQDQEFAAHVAANLGCRMHIFSITYLRPSLGGVILYCNGWNLVVDMFRDKLAMWKSRNLLMGGKLTLIESVLGFNPFNSL